MPFRTPKKELGKRRRRFREIVAWAFDGNLSMASEVLGVPFSTLQRWHTQGLRHVAVNVIIRLETVCGAGFWLVGEGELSQGKADAKTLPEQQEWLELEATNDSGTTYAVPRAVWWRVERLVREMAKRSTEPENDNARALLAFFCPIYAGIDLGIIDGEDRSIKQAEHVHALARYWESELGIGRPDTQIDVDVIQRRAPSAAAARELLEDAPKRKGRKK